MVFYETLSICTHVSCTLLSHASNSILETSEWYVMMSTTFLCPRCALPTAESSVGLNLMIHALPSVEYGESKLSEKI